MNLTKIDYRTSRPLPAPFLPRPKPRPAADQAAAAIARAAVLEVLG